MQLLATLAAHRAEDVARGTAGVYAYKDGLAVSDVTLDQCDMLETIALLLEGDEAEVAPLRGHGDLFTTLYDALRAEAVGDEILDGDDLQAEALSDLPQLGKAGHRTILVDDLDECGYGLQASQTGQVNGRFGMPRTTQDTLVASTQWADVTRTGQIAWGDIGVS